MRSDQFAWAPTSFRADCQLAGIVFDYCFQIDQGDRVSIECARVKTVRKKRNSRIKVPRQYESEFWE